MKTKIVLLLLTMLLASGHTARAQTALVSSIIAGGGDENATIGQWDVGAMTSGTPTVASGFWNAEEVPWVRIQRTGGSMLIAWPASFVAFQLEQSSVMGVGAVWGSVATMVNVANGENQITLSIGPGTRFLRLRKP